jgi:beta-1,4-mannosyltransferase
VATPAVPRELPARAARASTARRIACFPPTVLSNPYVDLLYGALAAHGLERVAAPTFSVRWLTRARTTVSILHVHWPEGLYRVSRPFPEPLASLAAVVKLALFQIRLAAARLLGYRIVWTVHQPLPHERTRGDVVAARALARAAHTLVAHDEGTAANAVRALDCSARKIRIVPHGSYDGVYRETRGRDEVRRALGVEPSDTVFLCFGEVRGYKSVDVLLAAWRTAGLADAVLVVAGHPKDPRLESTLRAAHDRSIRLLLERIPDDAVADLYAAADISVVARGDGGTSGALVLALTLGKPVVAAAVPSVHEALGGRDAGWLFEPDAPGSLAEAIRRAHADPERARRASQARDAALALAWPSLAARAASALTGSPA